jgi:hypothetical protein
MFNLRRRWLVAVTAGELAGFSIPAIVGATAYAAGLDGLGFLAALVIAGAGEGAVLGLAQSHVLCRCIPALRRRDWVVATASAAAFAWLLGMLPSTLGERLEQVPLALLIPFAALGAVALLLSIGVAQWVVLRHHLPRASRWIAANALAWIAALPVPFVLLGASSGAGPVVQALAGVAAGAVMGAVVAAVTGHALAQLLSLRAAAIGR